MINCEMKSWVYFYFESSAINIQSTAMCQDVTDYNGISSPAATAISFSQ